MKNSLRGMDLQLFIVYDFLSSAILPYNQNEQYTIILLKV